MRSLRECEIPTTDRRYCIYSGRSQRSCEQSGISGSGKTFLRTWADRECRLRSMINDIDEFIGIINRIAQDHPILVDKYLQGKEIEVDAVCDGEDILIPGIMEHIERAGIHSGDSISVYPAQSLTQRRQKTDD